jgi:hypothetical protein
MMLSKVVEASREILMREGVHMSGMIWWLRNMPIDGDLVYLLVSSCDLDDGGALFKELMRSSMYMSAVLVDSNESMIRTRRVYEYTRRNW